MGKKRVIVPISTARKQLFQLTDLVRKSADDTVVVLEQRGEREPVALVREARLAYLESKVQELAKGDKRPFKLAGSLKSDMDPDAVADALRELRKAWSPQHSLKTVTRPRGVKRRRR